MKNFAKFAVAGLAATILSTSGSLANDSEIYMIDNHHGTITYLPHIPTSEPTFAFGGSKPGSRATAPTVRRAESKSSDSRWISQEISTTHGAVGYFAPVK